jgi:hypothetical protein
VVRTPALLMPGPAAGAAARAGLTWGRSPGWRALARKTFAAMADARGLLSVPAGVDDADLERAGYVAALQAANGGAWLR